MPIIRENLFANVKRAVDDRISENRYAIREA